MRVFLRNLMVAGVFVLMAAGARAQPAVIWTFSGLPLNQIYDSDNNFVQNATGGIQPGGTMTFDSAGNLLDFNFTTDGTPTQFGFNYNFSSSSYFAANDPSNPLFGSGAWAFFGLDGSGGQHVLALGLGSDINVPWGPGVTNPVAIVPGSTMESFSKTGDAFDGDYRIPVDIDNNGLVGNAIQVPEPASMALLGVGLLGLGLISRRRNRKLG